MENNLKYDHLFHRDLDPFNRIITKEKKFEIRLNDEKRQKVKI
jgi:ASC-1-like (ASCH) protein